MAGDVLTWRRATTALLRAIVPVLLALVTAGFIILLMGKDPLQFFGAVWRYGVTGTNWQDSLVLMAPLAIIAVGLIFAFRGQLWNLGYNGQYLLGSVVASGLAPALYPSLPGPAVIVVVFVGAVVVGAAWSLVPAILKARFGTNEIITSLVMSFIAQGIVNLLIKGPLRDPSVPAPQTAVVDPQAMLPVFGDTKVGVGLVIAIVLAIAAQFLLSRTAFGVRLDVFGSNPKAAEHVGISSRWMIVLLFSVSGALIALAGSVDVLGHYAYQRANWNPSYGDAVMPFVFLARLNPLGALPLIAFYSVFATGGILAAQRAGLNSDFLLVVVGLILVFMTITELVAERRRLGQSYLPPGMKQTLLRPFRRTAPKGAQA